MKYLHLKRLPVTISHRIPPASTDELFSGHREARNQVGFEPITIGFSPRLPLSFIVRWLGNSMDLYLCKEGEYISL
jgi:hypothetical protein